MTTIVHFKFSYRSSASGNFQGIDPIWLRPGAPVPVMKFLEKDYNANATCGIRSLLGALALFAFFVPADGALGAQTLGQFPLCEASAAAVLPFPGATGTWLVVGDNEVNDKLFRFSVENGTVAPDAEQVDIALNNSAHVADIEGFAPLPPDRLLVWGSHSRDRKCNAEDARRRFVALQLSNNDVLTGQAVQSGPIRSDTLLAGVKGDTAVWKAVGTAIDDAEKRASDIENDLSANRISKEQAKYACNHSGAFNSEGAVAVPASHGQDVWIGLRAPLLPIHPLRPEARDLAILLRLDDLTAFRANRAALLDLDGRGVRDLALAGDWVYVIAGPSEDRSERFQLRRFNRTALDEDGVIATEFVAWLPTSSEGLAFFAARRFVVIDGDKGNGKNGACLESAGLDVSNEL